MNHKIDNVKWLSYIHPALNVAKTNYVIFYGDRKTWPNNSCELENRIKCG